MIQFKNTKEYWIMASKLVGGTMGLNIPLMFAHLWFFTSPYENISLIFWFVKIKLHLHINFDNIVGGKHNEPWLMR